MPRIWTTQTNRRAFLNSLIGGAALAGSSCSGPPPAPEAKTEAVQVPDQIKAFCVDFNWEPHGLTDEERGDWPNRFAKPGLWADASPREHVAWYKALGANVMQTFAVSCNGYAWYKSDRIPPQPGLKHDFLTESVDLGHEQGIMVVGYFCIGSNTRWGKENPDLSYGTPSTQHIPFTDEYLEFLGASIEDTIKSTDLDGFMIDWVWNPNKNLRKSGWIESEKELYSQLMSKPFPEGEPPAGQELVDYERTAIDRCWARIHDVTKTARSDCQIWLSIGDPRRPEIAGSNMFREVDWAMNENANTDYIEAAAANKGSNTRLLQCLVGWQDHDSAAFLETIGDGTPDLYGFARPREDSLPLPIEQYLSKTFDSFLTDPENRYLISDRNIAALARYYNGLSLDYVSGS